ncbi:NAD-binding protein [Haloarcula sp. 1CSR25-25]|uniref:NAD-binding protein n=1 Tax=Haloarcula sp. 1CSR25-25 TaxID=2862545 RepID=UPI0028940873|nr:NAD-binding protein [Haloarcula sp. 1CSR25-25]MDT3437319.1 potassium transporter [Haloarcula sp. 1CSR25-25]
MTIRTHSDDTTVRLSAETSLLVVSDSYVAALLASDTDAEGAHLVTDSDRVAARTPDSVRTTVGNVTAAETLDSVTDAIVAVVALQRDQQTLLVTQLLRKQSEIDTIVILLNDPERREAFEHLANSIVCVPTYLSTELNNTLEQILPELPSHS